jgi:hypothetical protein
LFSVSPALLGFLVHGLLFYTHAFSFSHVLPVTAVWGSKTESHEKNKSGSVRVLVELGKLKLVCVGGGGGCSTSISSIDS